VNWKIYLIRHATPDRQRSDIPYNLPPGPPLTRQGEEEAIELGEFLREETKVKILLSSPMERAMRTAQIAAQTAGMRYTVAPEIIEQRLDEPVEAIHRRMWAAFTLAHELILTGGEIGLVTHGGPAGVLLQALDMDLETLTRWKIFDYANPMPPAGVWRISRQSAGEPWEFKFVFHPENSKQAVSRVI
jgi:broad specificity phosphatase PhoE